MKTAWGIPIPDRGYGPGDCPPCVGWGTLSLGASCRWCDGTGRILDVAAWLMADLEAKHAAFEVYILTVPGGAEAIVYATAAMLKMDAENIIRATKRRNHDDV